MTRLPDDYIDALIKTPTECCGVIFVFGRTLKHEIYTSSSWLVFRTLDIAQYFIDKRLLSIYDQGFSASCYQWDDLLYKKQNNFCRAVRKQFNRQLFGRMSDVVSPKHYITFSRQLRSIWVTEIMKGYL